MLEENSQNLDRTLVKPLAAATASPLDQTLKAPLSGAEASSLDNDAQRLVRLVEKLPLEEREAVTLFYFDRWPLDRVAGTMQRTPEQIVELLVSAAGHLRFQLGKA